MNTPESNLSQKERVARLIAAKKKVIELREGLPFLHGWPWYQWAYDFFHCKEKIALLCAANQISKSSTQIRTLLDWATNKKLWPILWRRPPTQFWYLYPSQKIVNAEWLTKWLQFMPKGKYKDDPIYGWELEKRDGNVLAIHFKSGVHVFFKTYSQNPEDLQSGSVDAVFCDEELDADLYDELINRINATDGYFRMVFTATQGQEFWRLALEPRDDEKENLPNAWKRTVSLYDSMEYMDGEPSLWTEERIGQIKARCRSDQEILKRVYGKFILLGGRKYEAFNISKHMKPFHKIPEGWLIYEGVDIGGGGTSHKSAIVFIAVRPDFRAGRVFLSWRGDDGDTTAGDVFKQHIEMKQRNQLKPVLQLYDWAAKDFATIAGRSGEPFSKAEKGQDIGEDILNTLFKNDMLLVYDTPENRKLANELMALMQSTPKERARDDLCDGLRFACTKVPWDFSFLTGEGPSLHQEEKKLNEKETEIAARRKDFEEGQKAQNTLDEEFDEWNEAYG